MSLTKRSRNFVNILLNNVFMLKTFKYLLRAGPYDKFYTLNVKNNSLNVKKCNLNVTNNFSYCRSVLILK